MALGQRWVPHAGVRECGGERRLQPPLLGGRWQSDSGSCRGGEFPRPSVYCNTTPGSNLLAARVQWGSLLVVLSSPLSSVTLSPCPWPNGLALSAFESRKPSPQPHCPCLGMQKGPGLGGGRWRGSNVVVRGQCFEATSESAGFLFRKEGTGRGREGRGGERGKRGRGGGGEWESEHVGE